MATRILRKQISMFFPLEDWKILRNEAARLRIPLTELCRQWLGPEVERLKQDRRDVPTGVDHE